MFENLLAYHNHMRVARNSQKENSNFGDDSDSFILHNKRKVAYSFCLQSVLLPELHCCIYNNILCISFVF